MSKNSSTDRSIFVSVFIVFVLVSSCRLSASGYAIRRAQDSQESDEETLGREDFLGYDLSPQSTDDDYAQQASDDLFIMNPSDDLDDDEHSLDVAVKLKKDYADDFVSDLFALSHGLIKVARVSELDDENCLFHFKLANIPLDDGDMNPDDMIGGSRRAKRSKRHIENKIDSLKADDRVVYVLPQQHLRRYKRSFNSKSQMRSTDYDDLIDELVKYLNEEDSSEDRTDFMQKRKLSASQAGDYQADEKVTQSDLDYLKENLYSILRDNSIKLDDRKKIYQFFQENAQLGKELDSKTNQIKEQIKEESVTFPKPIDFNDNNYREQWYLINDGQLQTPPDHDLNVREAWLKGYTGKNINIVIVDDGLDHEHPDFQGKYRADLSYDYNDENDTNHDPMPSTFDDQNNHGTRCAGAAAANANNSVCGVGVAYDANIAGIRILDGPITDLLEARALTYKAEQVDIRSASWGPRDDGAHMEYPGKFVNLALEEGVRKGRNGKGTIYIWATGNGGANEDDCSCDGYVSHWNIISIGSVNHRGRSPYFMELCPSTMAVVYSGGQTKLSGDSDDPGVRVVASDVRGKCTTKFQGTSSAAPLAAGAIALVLEANSNLTYRDVMHLIARTSRIPNIEDTDGWIVNGANYHVNEKYGFGVLDASQMIQEAQKWVNVPERQRCEVKFNGKLPELGPSDNIELELDLNPTDCPNVQMLEHVVANISFLFSTRGDLKLTLISPSGTPSEILSYRKNDKSNKGVLYFPFMTVFNWGESPVGTWKLKIQTRTKPGQSANSGRIGHFSLTLFGTQTTPTTANGHKRFASGNHASSQSNDKRAYVPDIEDLKDIYDNELKSSRQVRLVSKRKVD